MVTVNQYDNTIQSEAFMQTPLGLLPVNSEGMRKLCDALSKKNQRNNELETSINSF